MLQANLDIISPTKDELFHEYCVQQQLHQFLMGRLHEFEPVCGRLFHHSTLPTTDQDVNKLVQEETCTLIKP